MKNKAVLAIAGVSGAIAVMLGAFAAHGLKSQLSGYLMGVFETGVQYQFIHTLAILICGILLQMKLGAKSQKYFLIAAIC
ncbi:MAG: DUF423 domain-containing protein, partial [Vibrio cyclitrophicus]